MDPELQTLIDSVLLNPEKIYDLPEDKVIELHQALDRGMYAPSDASDKEYINISISNLRDEYQRKFLMTSIIGYLFQTLDEWDPYEDCSESERDEQLSKIVKGQVSRFLERNLKYNPNRHVSGAHTNSKDTERPTKDSMLESRLVPVVNTLSTNAAVLDTAKRTYQSLVKTDRVLTSCVDSLAETDAEMHGVILKQREECRDLLRSVGTGVKQLCDKDTTDTYLIEPPVDVFYHWDRYIHNNYEQLREATNVLYNDKPDLEFAIHYFGHYDTKEKADTFKRKNESRFISPVLTIENGAWTLLGPFKENRGRVEFYNKNTEILKRIFDQMETDQKLGKDLMKKKVIKAKTKEYRQFDGDPKGLEEYKDAMGTIESLGAQPILSLDEKRKLAEAVKVRDMAEVPADAIQVDVFQKDKDGNLIKGKFYTKAEDPQSVTEQMNKIKGKVLRDKYGNKVSLSEVQSRK
jgi:hypothetical protein